MHIKIFKPPPPNNSFMIDLSKAVVLFLQSVACCSVRVSMTFYLKCAYIILVQFQLLSGYLFKK